MKITKEANLSDKTYDELADLVLARAGYNPSWHSCTGKNRTIIICRILQRRRACIINAKVSKEALIDYLNS